MRSSKPQLVRNKVDLGDPSHVRQIKKRLRLSSAELTEIAGRIGDSIAAITKEFTAQRAGVVPKPPQLPPVAAIATVTASDPAAKITISDQAP